MNAKNIGIDIPATAPPTDSPINLQKPRNNPETTTKEKNIVREYFQKAGLFILPLIEKSFCSPCLTAPAHSVGQTSPGLSFAIPKRVSFILTLTCGVTILSLLLI